MKNPPPSSDFPTPMLPDFDPKAIYREAEMRNKLRREEELRTREAERLLQFLEQQDTKSSQAE